MGWIRAGWTGREERWVGSRRPLFRLCPYARHIHEEIRYHEVDRPCVCACAITIACPAQGPLKARCQTPCESPCGTTTVYHYKTAKAIELRCCFRHEIAYEAAITALRSSVADETTFTALRGCITDEASSPASLWGRCWVYETTSTIAYSSRSDAISRS